MMEIGGLAGLFLVSSSGYIPLAGWAVVCLYIEDEESEGVE
jgi:hypothetical protein